MYHNNRPFINITQFNLDLLFLIISYISAYFFVSRLVDLFGIQHYIWVLLVFAPVWIFVMYQREMYDLTTFKYMDRMIKSIIIATAFSGLNSAAMVFFIKDHLMSRLFIVIFIVLSFVILLTERYMYTFILRKKFKKLTKNIVIIGNDEITQKFLHYVKKTNILVHVCQIYDLDNDYDLINFKNYTLMEELNTVLKKEAVSEVVFTLPAPYVDEIEKYALAIEEMGISISIALDLFDSKYSKINHFSIGTISLLTYHSVCLDTFQLFLKRMFDICGAIVGLLLTGVLSLFIVPAIKLESKGPALFTQKRIGINGRTFPLYKFRSMVIDAEEQKKNLTLQNEIEGDLMFKIKDDPRVTKIGKFLRATSLDELPQFINVLKGEMSLVGTRPPTQDEVAKYQNHHWRRISIKPGITGLWQVSGRSSITDFDEVVKLDTQYIDHWSIWLDLSILFKTVTAVFKKSGAY